MTATRTLTVALQEGFDDDTVLISTASDVHETIDHVSTRTQIGLAREVTITVPVDTSALKITLPAKGIERDVGLDELDGAYLGVSIDPVGQHITIRQSAEPFGYV